PPEVPMNPPLPQLREIFGAALDYPAGAERNAYVVDACRGDEALLDRVRALLLAHDGAGEFLADGGTGSAGATGDPTEAAPARALDPFGRVAAGPEVGSRIGPYKLLQAIGEGGMGIVFMAEQERPVRRRVALKVIKAGMDTSQVVARFEA